MDLHQVNAIVQCFSGCQGGDRGSSANIPVKAVNTPVRWAIAGLSPHDFRRTFVGND
jgi:integrase